jgi:hypothetical protein
MPKVGKKHYPYTQAGMNAAKNEASKTGQDIQVSDARNRSNVSMGYKGGGPVKVMPPGVMNKKGTKDPFDTIGREYQKGGEVVQDFSEGRWNDLLPDVATPSTPAVYGQPRVPIEPMPSDVIQGDNFYDRMRPPADNPLGDQRPAKGEEYGDIDPKTGVTYKKGGKTKPSFKVTGSDDYAEKMAKHIGSGGSFGNAKGGKLSKKYKKGGKTKPSFKVTGSDDYAEKMAKHIGSGGAFGNAKGGKLKKKEVSGRISDWIDNIMMPMMEEGGKTSKKKQKKLTKKQKEAIKKQKKLDIATGKKASFKKVTKKDLPPKPKYDPSVFKSKKEWELEQDLMKGRKENYKNVKHMGQTKEYYGYKKNTDAGTDARLGLKTPVQGKNDKNPPDWAEKKKSKKKGK